jgi:hypothetical protein
LSMEGDILLARIIPRQRDVNLARRFPGRPGPPHRTTPQVVVLVTSQACSTVSCKACNVANLQHLHRR